MIPSAPLGTDAAEGLPGLDGLGATVGVGPQRAAAERRFRFELAAHPGSPAQARRLTRAWLASWSVCEDTCDTATLVVSELVTNAIVHTASSRVLCELHDGDDLVRIAVRDEGCAPGDPRPSPRGPDEEHGRGLLLVGALSRTWGTLQHGTGLLVWAELARTADGVGPPGPPGPVAAEPRGDLGWGARPKPGTPGEPDEDAHEGTGDDGTHTGTQHHTGTQPHLGTQRHFGPQPHTHDGSHNSTDSTSGTSSSDYSSTSRTEAPAETHRHHRSTPDGARPPEALTEAHHGTGTAWA